VESSPAGWIGWLKKTAIAKSPNTLISAVQVKFPLVLMCFLHSDHLVLAFRSTAKVVFMFLRALYCHGNTKETRNIKGLKVCADSAVLIVARGGRKGISCL